MKFDAQGIQLQSRSARRTTLSRAPLTSALPLQGQSVISRERLGSGQPETQKDFLNISKMKLKKYWHVKVPSAPYVL
jgi:hypothetical protein